MGRVAAHAACVRQTPYMGVSVFFPEPAAAFCRGQTDWRRRRVHSSVLPKASSRLAETAAATGDIAGAGTRQTAVSRQAGSLQSIIPLPSLSSPSVQPSSPAALSLGASVGVIVGVRVGVRVNVGVRVGVLVRVKVGVRVGVDVRVPVRVIVGLIEGVGVMVGVSVGANVDVCVPVAVSVGVSVGSGVSVSAAV